MPPLRTLPWTAGKHRKQTTLSQGTNKPLVGEVLCGRVPRVPRLEGEPAGQEPRSGAAQNQAASVGLK